VGKVSVDRKERLHIMNEVLNFDGCLLLLCAECPLNCAYDSCELHDTDNDYAICTKCWGYHHLMDFEEAGQCFRKCWLFVFIRPCVGNSFAFWLSRSPVLCLHISSQIVHFICFVYICIKGPRGIIAHAYLVPWLRGRFRKKPQVQEANEQSG